MSGLWLTVQVSDQPPTARKRRRCPQNSISSTKNGWPHKFVHHFWQNFHVYLWDEHTETDTETDGYFQHLQSPWVHNDGTVRSAQGLANGTHRSISSSAKRCQVGPLFNQIFFYIFFFLYILICFAIFVYFGSRADKQPFGEPTNHDKWLEKSFLLTSRSSTTSKLNQIQYKWSDNINREWRGWKRSHPIHSYFQGGNNFQKSCGRPSPGTYFFHATNAGFHPLPWYIARICSEMFSPFFLIFAISCRFFESFRVTIPGPFRHTCHRRCQALSANGTNNEHLRCHHFDLFWQLGV